MNKIKRCFLSLIFMPLIATMGCNSTEKQKDNIGSVQTTSLTNESDFFIHSKKIFPENIYIEKASFYNDEVYYVAKNNFEHRVMQSHTIDEFGTTKDTVEGDIKEFNYCKATYSSDDNDIVFIVCDDGNEQYKLFRYNTKNNKIEKSIKIENIPSEMWSVQGNIFLSYEYEDISICKYNENLELIDKPEITGLPENEYIYKLKYINDKGYGCFLYDGSLRFISLNQNFEYILTSDEKLSDDVYNYTFTDRNSVVIFETEESDQTTLYEISYDTGETVNTLCVNQNELYTLYNGFGQYEFLYLKEGASDLYGYDLDEDKSVLLYQVTSDYVTDIVCTHENELHVICSDDVNDTNNTFLINSENGTSVLTYDDFLSDIFIDSNKYFYLLYLDAENQKSVLQKKDEYNNVISTIDVFLIHTVLQKLSVSDESICALVKDYESDISSILLFDSDSGKKTLDISLDGIEELNGEEIRDLKAYQGYIYVSVNDEIFKLDHEKNLSKIELADSLANIKFVDGPDKYDFCLSDDFGLYGYIGAEKSFIQIASWNNCDIDLPYKNLIKIMSDNSFCILGSAGTSEEVALYKFEKCDDSQKDKVHSKKQITIASTDFSLTDINSASKPYIDLINQVNKTSDTLRILIKKYDNYDSMKVDLLSGNSLDILLTNDYNNNLFKAMADISPYIDQSEGINDDNFFTNLLDLNKTSQITLLPSSFCMYSLVGKQAEIGSTEMWTLNNYLQATENSKSSDDLSNAMYIMFTMNLNSYINYRENKCNINNKDTVSLMNRIKEIYSSSNESEYEDSPKKK